MNKSQKVDSGSAPRNEDRFYAQCSSAESLEDVIEMFNNMPTEFQRGVAERIWHKPVRFEYMDKLKECCIGFGVKAGVSEAVVRLEHMPDNEFISAQLRIKAYVQGFLEAGGSEAVEEVLMSEDVGTFDKMTAQYLQLQESLPGVLELFGRIPEGLRSVLATKIIKRGYNPEFMPNTQFMKTQLLILATAYDVLNDCQMTGWTPRTATTNCMCLHCLDTALRYPKCFFDTEIEEAANQARAEHAKNFGEYDFGEMTVDEILDDIGTKYTGVPFPHTFISEPIKLGSI